MNITTKIIITDTNIITDLNNAAILDKFVCLENVYINDMVKNDEINFSTGDVSIINKLKVLGASSEQVMEMYEICKENKKLSNYDVINYIIARDNNYILATGDNRLKAFSEQNGIEVIRTLKIIRLMKENNIISVKKAVEACILLKNNSCTRIPIDDINDLIKELERDLSVC